MPSIRGFGTLGILVILLSVLASVLVVPTYATNGSGLTNAERLRRGLHPNAPHRLYHPGEQLLPRQSPTPTTPSDISEPTPSDTPEPPPPSVCYSGIIQIYSPNEPLYYFTHFMSDSGVFLGAVNGGDMIGFCTSGDDFFEIQNGGSSDELQSYPYIGAILSTPTGDISDSTGNGAFIGAVPETAAGTYPGTTTNSIADALGASLPGQSTIWKFDPDTAALTIFWTNSDGSLQPAHVVWVPDFGGLAITGNVDLFNSEGSFSGEEVTLSLVPWFQPERGQSR
ncbi:hypothetical protein C8Q75DRAFT_802973 [Abortiporus biennis]|nr:hypothetical protein C8Q75DRAFT_802973 [Abortiporus biennis]